ncbi:hypothetical protein H4Q26_014791 [Puccinia striiformis f. sp. tritici PST-130]|nr:hypothetical protein H4Q26_014791 [Puccinia striiformis f. sp. tritici PST-130]
MRFDIWVKNEVSAGLQRSLRLDFKGRKILSEEIKEKNLSWEETIMRSMLPRYRLCRWVATRDQPLTKGLVQGSTKDKAARINVLTWNINGIKSKLPALKALLDDNVLKRVEKVQVDTVSSSVSDHWPVVQFQNNELVNVATKPTPVKAWNRKALQGHGMELALSDRWDVFKSDNIENEGDLNEVAHQWVETLNTIGEELGMLAVPKEQQAFEFDRKTKALVKRARRSRKALEKADPNLHQGL